MRGGRRRKPALENGDTQPDGDAAFLPPPGHRVCQRETKGSRVRAAAAAGIKA